MLSSFATPLSYLPNPYMRRKIFQYPKSGDYKTDFWGIHSMELHPSGIAIAPWSGYLAICTYDAYTSDDKPTGHLFIWKKLTDFCNYKKANYHYSMDRPQSVAFDNNETLYVSSPENGTIHYTEDINIAPDKMFRLDANATNNATNPRGMAFNDDNEMYVMCSNKSSGRNASIVKVNNPANPDLRQMQEMLNSEQSEPGALALAIWGDKLYTTDLNGLAKRTSVNRYAIDENILVNKKSMPDSCGHAGMTMDITSDGDKVYFTNLVDGNAYVTQWDVNSLSPNPTRNFKLGSDAGQYTAWGIVVYEGFIIVADTARNQVKIIQETQLEY
ncbi:hypothetical protein F0919_15885 [Taibaiella lutea]|uniref:SMP-30/Gluconolactonase/LRE-like region domain-containing protein n=1 Tax=Taibaiella lutea TaxID=2608001 RepID=A0A5M6CAT0_9BACT|nr:hypothetical protein [Taibaiella lutea]KAA5532276.1 hypothetical protein F0919_15885 [Taibaiella lutea]